MRKCHTFDTLDDFWCVLRADRNTGALLWGPWAEDTATESLGVGSCRILSAAATNKATKHGPIPLDDNGFVSESTWINFCQIHSSPCVSSIASQSGNRVSGSSLQLAITEKDPLGLPRIQFTRHNNNTTVHKLLENFQGNLSTIPFISCLPSLKMTKLVSGKIFGTRDDRTNLTEKRKHEQRRSSFLRVEMWVQFTRQTAPSFWHLTSKKTKRILDCV